MATVTYGSRQPQAERAARDRRNACIFRIGTSELGTILMKSKRAWKKLAKSCKILRKIPPPPATIPVNMGKNEPESASLPDRARPNRDLAEDDRVPTMKPAIDWSAALAEHRGWLRSVLAARLGERDAVDEVLQEVAVAAVSSKAPPTDPDRVGPWLYKVAVRRALMYRRAKGRQRRLMQSYAEDRVKDCQPSEASTERDPLDWLLSSERQVLARQAVSRLHHRDREMLLLKYTQGWSYGQIAERLGVSHSAVESRLHRARQKLRSELAKEQITSATS